jgi:UDP-N-acetyl-D-mannosaminuronic acid transferase (WecB/TagA/CpsF family)
MKIDVLIIGMGTPFQELQAIDMIEISETIDRKLLIFTCGAWLEQLLYKNFYPSWAYSLRLNWLVRLIRNPKKLWKRYFVESFKVWFTKTEKIEYLNTLPGYNLMQQIS